MHGRALPGSQQFPLPGPLQPQHSLFRARFPSICVAAKGPRVRQCVVLCCALGLLQTP